MPHWWRTRLRNRFARLVPVHPAVVAAPATACRLPNERVKLLKPPGFPANIDRQEPAEGILRRQGQCGLACRTGRKRAKQRDPGAFGRAGALRRANTGGKRISPADKTIAAKGRNAKTREGGRLRDRDKIKPAKGGGAETAGGAPHRAPYPQGEPPVGSQRTAIHRCGVEHRVGTRKIHGPTPGTSVALSSPNGLWVGGDGVVYVLDTGNGKVRWLDTNGVMTTLFTDHSGITTGRGLWVKDDRTLAYFGDAQGTDMDPRGRHPDGQQVQLQRLGQFHRRGSRRPDCDGSRRQPGVFSADERRQCGLPRSSLWQWRHQQCGGRHVGQHQRT